ncbi:Uma2 family endonuclease [Dyadobacter fanqingshengii]|uniref:Uma2 family endonuclease n=1 Tax=Dyadobacter fanqingshengii TaxID=2906443 RepID=A0A9X1PCG8_9BACT|nr:Uma2 family endonuclease [Dyadobacter fanqingshengii]MCF0042431.1 Uma2 family endonuclease [Dyadobacter fanqingshengii]USJ35044.1 Uma2 family endonuclease [Dyadobacter fanqingshengii]
METLLLETVIEKRIVSEILNEPNAYLIINAITAVLNKEREQRIKFYNDITEQEKVEFINGEIVVHSPAKLQHNRATLLLAQLLNLYSIEQDLGFVGVEKIMIKLTRNDYEPDICYFKSEKADQFKEDQILFPTPDLIVEVISTSTESKDRGIKFKDYEAHKVEEYWIADPENQTIEQYHLVGEEYALVLKSSQGFIESFVVEGFKIPIAAIFDKAVNAKAMRNI